MLRIFVLTLLSSWIASPLGILIAQHFGVANAHIVVLVLLAIGTCVPFQLLLNECLAATANRGNTAPTKFQITLVIFAQLIASIWTLWGLSAQVFQFSRVVIVVIFLAFNTLISYSASLMYYSLVVRNKIRTDQAMTIGATSGLTNLGLYFMFCMASLSFYNISYVFVLATLLLPSLIQWLYVRKIKIKTSHVPHKPADIKLPPLSTTRLIVSLVALAFLTSLSTNMRDEIASTHTNYISFLLIAMNSLITLINTITRATFLSENSSSKKQFLLKIAILGIMFFLAANVMNINGTIFTLISAQAMIAWVIDATRTIPAAPHRSSIY